MPRKKPGTLLVLLDARVRDIAPEGATAGLLLRLQAAFARGVEAGKGMGGAVVSGSGTPTTPPSPPADAKAADRAAKAQREEEARNVCLEVYMDDARLLLPGVPDDVLLDALESDKSMREQFQSGHVPGERARVLALQRVLSQRGLLKVEGPG